MRTLTRILPIVHITSATLTLMFLEPMHAQSLAPNGLTAIDGIKVGHFTLAEGRTGCTVILTEEGVVGGVDVRGGAPGTHETDLLNPVNSVDQVHGIFLTGGSAFGLSTHAGVSRYLEARGAGFPTSAGRVPIVAGATIFDLPVIGKPPIRPDAECGYRAAQSASNGPIAEGNVGAGAGATVGKLAGYGRAMKGGVGTASIRLDNGLIIAALVVVNAVGDILDPSTGRVIAGVRTEDGRGLADARVLLRQSALPPRGELENTTLGVVATNAKLTKAQATKVAQMAHDGLARAIVPAHMPADGDTVFALATGRIESDDISRIGALGAEMMSEAIVRAARAAVGIPGYPAARDMK